MKSRMKIPVQLLIAIAAFAAGCWKADATPVPRTPCSVTFNEIKLADDFFVELKRTCQRRTGGTRPLRDYKLVIIRDDPTAIVYVLDLGLTELGFKDEEEYLLISSRKVGSIDPIFRTERAHAVPGPMEFNFQRGISYAFVLLRCENQDDNRKIRLLLIGQKFDYRRLDDIQDLGTIISKNTKDLTINCRGQKCEKLSDKMKSFLRMIDEAQAVVVPKTSIGVPDFNTLNSCYDKPFSYIDFKYGVETPGFINDCSGDSPVICEHIVDGIEPYVLSAAPKKFTINSRSYQKIFACTKENSPPKQSPKEKTMRLYRYYQLPEQLKSLRQQVQRSNVEVPAQCRQYLPNEGKLLDYPWIVRWVEGSQAGESCRLNCKMCQNFLALGFRPDFKNKDMLQLTTGFQMKSSNPKANRQFLLEHASKDLHLIATTFYEAAALYPNDLEKVIMDYVQAERDYYMPTANNIQMVFAESMKAVSFTSHEYFNPTLKSMGLDLGYHHYCRSAAVEVSKSISDTMHINLLKELLDKNVKFSFLTDASTDVSNNGLLACLLQTHDPFYKPHVFFYALLHLDEGEKAKDIYAKIDAQIKADDALVPGFEEYFRRNIVALVTDNASVMTSTKQSSLLLMFRKNIAETVISVGCMAHKVELVVKRAVDSVNDTSFGYFYEFEKDTNSFYTFFMSWGSKRFTHLEDVATEMDVGIIRLKKHLDVRWTASRYNVVAAVRQNLIPMRQTLDEISKDKDYTKSARDKAGNLYGVINSKRFILVLHEFLDFLPVFRRLSLELQKTGGVLPGKHSLINSVLNELETLKKQPGKELSKLLASCSCQNVCRVKTCSLVQVEACPKPLCLYTMDSDTDTGFVLSSERRRLYDAFKEQILSYFDINMLDSFEVLNPLTYLENGLVPRFYSLRSFQTKCDNVCEYFRIRTVDCSAFKINLESLISEVSTSGLVNSTTTPSQFIQALLKSEQISLPSKQVLETILVVPFGNADSERAFSFVTKIKPKQRFNLTPKNLENLVRIRMNSPSDPYLFDSYYYATFFLRSHIRSDDTARTMADICQTSDEPNDESFWIF